MQLPAVVEFPHHVYTYTLQITDEALILRRFPDEKISSRLWNDCISEISCSERRATVSIKYRDTHGEYSHHFHSKQVGKVPFLLHWENPLMSTTGMGLIPLERAHSHSKHFECKRIKCKNKINLYIYSMRVMLPYWTNSGNRSWTVMVDSKTSICSVSITTLAIIFKHNERMA